MYGFVTKRRLIYVNITGKYSPVCLVLGELGTRRFDENEDRSASIFRMQLS